MTTVANVMTRHVLVLQGDMTLREAISYLATQHVSGAPVFDGKRRLVGAVTASDILQAESEGADLDNASVADIMTSPTLTIGPEAELREAALAMEYADVHRLFVELNGELIGVVSRSDVSRALATGQV
jgi:predicted transcriptional regulator